MIFSLSLVAAFNSPVISSSVFDCGVAQSGTGQTGGRNGYTSNLEKITSRQRFLRHHFGPFKEKGLKLCKADGLIISPICAKAVLQDTANAFFMSTSP